VLFRSVVPAAPPEIDRAPPLCLSCSCITPPCVSGGGPPWLLLVVSCVPLCPPPGAGAVLVVLSGCRTLHLRRPSCCCGMGGRAPGGWTSRPCRPGCAAACGPRPWPWRCTPVSYRTGAHAGTWRAACATPGRTRAPWRTAGPCPCACARRWWCAPGSTSSGPAPGNQVLRKVLLSAMAWCAPGGRAAGGVDCRASYHVQYSLAAQQRRPRCAGLSTLPPPHPPAAWPGHRSHAVNLGGRDGGRSLPRNTTTMLGNGAALGAPTKDSRPRISLTSAARITQS